MEIDRAMRWGYGHTFGPFELWDALGFETTARRIEAEGRALPESIHLGPGYRSIDQGIRSCYLTVIYHDPGNILLSPLEDLPVIFDLRKRQESFFHTKRGARPAFSHAR